jgi:large subunit ribosomal protein L23
VQVTQVRVMNQKGKLKRHGARRGRRSDWKKAYVKLAADQDINLAGVE